MLFYLLLLLPLLLLVSRETPGEREQREKNKRDVEAIAKAKREGRL